jgi:hypothetical protein
MMVWRRIFFAGLADHSRGWLDAIHPHRGVITLKARWKKFLS